MQAGADNDIRSKKNILYCLSIDIVRTYETINPDFKAFDVSQISQRLLTQPSVGVTNSGRDNEDANLICKVYDKLYNSGTTDAHGSTDSNGCRIYTVLDLLGMGTFGQVFRCQCNDTGKIVAVKVVKNKPAYHDQALMEIKIAKILNGQYDSDDKCHIVRYFESFKYCNHVCLVFELLSMSLLDVLTQNQFRGFPLSVVQRFTKQIVKALVTLEEANIIHCDLKPENILLVPSPPRHSHEKIPVTSTVSLGKKEDDSDDRSTVWKEFLRNDSINMADDGSASKDKAAASPTVNKSSLLSDIKVIDFGSACFEGCTVYSYIQSRFYRSPEVLLGAPYTGAIDIWSLACVCAEMFLGLPLFPGVSQHNQLSRIVEMFGVPPDFLIESKNGSKYFTLNTSKDVSENVTTSVENEQLSSNRHCEASVQSDGHAPSKYRIKTPEEYAAATNSAVPMLKKYLRYSKLEEVIMKCPVANKSKMTNEQKTVEMMKRKCFLDFLKGLFNLNPFERWTAKQAASHPFITNAAYTGHYVPEPDKRNHLREADFFIQNQKFKHAHAPATVASPLNTSLSRGKATSIVDPTPSERADAHQDDSSFVMLKNSSRRQTEPVDLHHKAKKDSSSEDHGRPRLRRGNPVHMKQSGGDNSNSGQHNHPTSHYMQSNWQRGDDHSDNSQQPWQPPHLRLPIQQPYSSGVSPSMHQSQLLPNGAFVSNQMPLYPPNQYSQYGSPQTWISTSQGSYPHNYPPNMMSSNGCMTVQQGIPIHAHPQVMFPMQYQVANGSEGYYASPPNSYTMIPGQHLPHPNVTSSSGYLPMGSSASSSLMYGSNSSMIEGNAMVMTDFGLALLRPEVNENRMFHSYFMQPQQQQHLIQNQFQQQQQQHSPGSMGMFTPYGSISSSLQRPLHQPSSSFGTNSYSNTSGGNSYNMQQNSRSKAHPVSQASSYERRPRGGSLSNSTMDHTQKRRDVPQFHEYEALLGGSEAHASSFNTRASSIKESQYKSFPENLPPGSSEGVTTERSRVGKSIVAKTDLDKSNSTVSSRETRMQDDYASNGLSNSESTYQNYHPSNQSRSTKKEKEKAKSSSSIVRVNSSDSLVNVDPTTEAIADWDPFFVADDISHEDDGSGRRLDSCPPDDASDEEQN